MSAESLLTKFLDQGCLPHQAEFAVDFFAPKSAQKHLLVSAPGMGKSFAVGAVIRHAAATGVAKRILVLAPPPLVAQWHDILRRSSEELVVLTVDRRRFREMEANKSADNPVWPALGVVLVSIELAKQTDVADSLAHCQWDLLVVDEAHQLANRNQRYQLVANLMQQSPKMRVIFLLTGGPWSVDDADDNDLTRDAATTLWNRDNVRDKDGKPLLPEVQIEWISHQRHVDEVKVLSALQDLLRNAGTAHPQLRMIAVTLLQTASSSLFALEQRLRRIVQKRNELVHGIASPGQSESEDEDVSAFDTTPRGPSTLDWMQPEFVSVVNAVLQMLDNVETDSKFDALQNLLDKSESSVGNHPRICVFTRYADTADYLESALSEHYPKVTALTGRKSISDRTPILDEFAQSDGILIATEAVSAMFPEVAAVIFYDLPLNPVVLNDLIGRFVRVGRRNPVRVFAFTDESGALVVERLQRKLTEVQHVPPDRELQRMLFSDE